MKPRQRLLRANPQTVGQENLSAVDLLLHLTCAADIAREEIYRPLQDTARLSEGKLSLLMTLKDAGGEMSIGMLAQHLPHAQRGPTSGRTQLQHAGSPCRDGPHHRSG